MDEENLKDWEKVSKAFFAKPAVSTSEDFVERVMSRLEEPAPRPWLRWALPAAGLAALSVFFSLTEPVKDSVVSTESILLASDDESSSLQWVAGEEPEPAEWARINLEVI